jgi:hypothetical protein
MAALNSASRIGLTTISKDILTVDEGVCRWRIKNREIGNIFASALGTRGDMAKRSPPLDSAHQIGVSPLSREALT